MWRSGGLASIDFPLTRILKLNSGLQIWQQALYSLSHPACLYFIFSPNNSNSDRKIYDN